MVPDGSGTVSRFRWAPGSQARNGTHNQRNAHCTARAHPPARTLRAVICHACTAVKLLRSAQQLERARRLFGVERARSRAPTCSWQTRSVHRSSASTLAPTRVSHGASLRAARWYRMVLASLGLAGVRLTTGSQVCSGARCDDRRIHVVVRSRAGRAHVG